MAWPFFLPFLACFITNYFRNCLTVPKLRTILQLHCKLCIANSHCFQSLVNEKSGPPEPVGGGGGASSSHLSPYWPAIAALCNDIMTSSQKFILACVFHAMPHFGSNISNTSLCQATSTVYLQFSISYTTKYM